MISVTILSLVTSVKDYVEITHKLIEFEPLKNYTELGALFTYLIVSLGNVIKDFFSFSIFKNIWSIPIIIPDIASAMISEISVLDGYFHSAFTFLETNLNNGGNSVSSGFSSNTGILILEKFFIGLINSFFLFLPTSTSHLITLRRFAMQGIEAGYISGLGTLAGNFLWLSSIILGWRFFVIPWLSFDIFRYVLGFILIVKYIWDSTKERRMALEDLSKWKIFLLNFLLALTEQTCIYPFISNLSFGPEASILEGFPADNYASFVTIHGAYLLGILIGSFSLLQFACWFWENPAFSIYIWLTTKSSNKISTSSYYKILNFSFLYCTMLCAIASIPYYGLDYTITNPIGLVPQDRILEQKKSQSDTDRLITETAFLGVNPTDKNSRIRDGVHARRERWKQRLIKYQAYDASVYDQGIYDFLTIEDLNYGFDRFWLRRKMRNHQIRFRLFPGPWMRSLKKQLNKPASSSTEKNNKESSQSPSAIGPRIEFFRILFEQYYHPNFHDRTQSSSIALKQKAAAFTPEISNKLLPAIPLQGIAKPSSLSFLPELREGERREGLYPVGVSEASSSLLFSPKGRILAPPPSQVLTPIRGLVEGLGELLGVQARGQEAILNPVLAKKQLKRGLIYEHSALRKFVRNFNTRKNLKIAFKESNNFILRDIPSKETLLTSNVNRPIIYSKRWKSLFAKIQPFTKTSNYRSYFLFRNISKQITTPQNEKSLKSNLINQKLYNKDFLILAKLNNATNNHADNNLMLLRPLSFYLQKEQAFKRKLRYYGATTMRKLTIGNQAPYFKTLMKRGFYYYKPSLRLKKTLYVASMRRGFRKKSRKQKNILFSDNYQNKNLNQKDVIKNNNQANQGIILTQDNLWKANTELSSNKASYSVLNKRASRYRHQIYKDVLQHWYYTPFNRLALKFDIDAFINRQPKAHYLSKNEERMLHIKRFLLSEHYDTLRWYTYMQHYRTMKANIGGTKSFANRIYNQQFQGTFKKIRHLFAITPSQSSFFLSPVNPIGFTEPLSGQGNSSRNSVTERSINNGNNRVEALADFSILKFDQPLYNDNNLTDIKSIYLHEELLTAPSTLQELGSKGDNLAKDAPIGAFSFLSKRESEALLPELCKSTVDLKENKAQSAYYPQRGLDGLIESKSAFFASESNISNNDFSQAPTGLVCTTCIRDCLLSSEGVGVPKKGTNYLAVDSTINKPSLSLEERKDTTNFIYSELLVKLIKECKRYIYDQSFLKNYITHRIEKREQRNQEQTRELNKRLEKLKNWLNFQSSSNRNRTEYGKSPHGGYPAYGVRRELRASKDSFKTTEVKNEKTLVTTGIQKALNDSIFISEDINPLYSNKPLLKTQASIHKNKYSNISSVMENSSIKTEESIKAKILILKNAVSNSSNAIGTRQVALGESYLENKLLAHLGNTINNCKNVFKTQIQLIKIRSNKNIEWWRKKQRVITKRKNSRKRDRFKKEMEGVKTNIEKLVEKAKTEKYNLYKTLYGNYNKNEISNYILYPTINKSAEGDRRENNKETLIKTADSSLFRKKREDNLNAFSSLNNSNSGLMHSIWQKFFVKKYRKKPSSKGRRYKSLSYGRYLTATRKPKLIGIDPNSEGSVNPIGFTELLMAKVDNISGSNGFIINKKEKEEFLNAEKLYANNLIKDNQTQYLSVKDLKKSLKKSQINKRGRHTWRKYKRHKFNTAQSKYRKRRVQSRGKLRVMSKKLKKIYATHELRQWWWNSFLPRYLSNIYIPKGDKTSPVALSYPEGKARNSLRELLTPTRSVGVTVRQTVSGAWKGSSEALIKTKSTFDTDFKPLSKVDLKARSIKNEPIEQGISSKEKITSEIDFNFAQSSKQGSLSQSSGKKQEQNTNNNPQAGLLVANEINAFNTKNFDITTTNLPFYAGWDESLRKFVITNRLLSRRDAGQIGKGYPNVSSSVNPEGVYGPRELQSEGAINNNNFSFTNSPIQGLNEGTFLYLQTDMPFNSYNIDQFIPSNQSFYAPLGWRRFEFRHSVLKTWYNKINNKLNNTVNPKGVYGPFGYQKGEEQLGSVEPVFSSNLILSVKNVRKLLNSPSLIQKNNRQKSKFKRAIARRIKKRYKLLKQTPNQLMYTPTGPLLTEVLPSHYISVFDQQYRFPRNRYLKRNLLKTTKKTTLLAMLDSSKTQSGLKEFTLRKRVKPRRKYHRKRFIKKDGLIFPRRTKFTNYPNSVQEQDENMRWRPSNRIKQKSSLVDRSKSKSNKRVKTNPLRLRQLRRREFQQIIKPSQRYQPRNGGFTWPGDYLRLEAVEMPKLKADSGAIDGNDKMAKKPNQKINAQPVGIMPRKYLIEKHNILVLKKKLEKAHASHKLTQALKEYKLLTQKYI